MSIHWFRHDAQVDIELAVALEHGWRMVVTARAAGQIERATSYNLKLWRIVRGLALRWPGLNVRDSLVDTADHVATMLMAEGGPDPRDLAFIAGRNLSLARDTAAERTIELGRDALLAEWGRCSGGRFEPWLLGQIERHLNTP